MSPSIASSLLFLLFVATTDGCMRVTPGTPGMPATPCKSCAQSLITKTTVTAGGKEFASDQTVTTGVCAVRTFTCTGNMATIEINVDDGTIGDGGTGTATFSVTCNAAGTAWEAQGIAVTRISCASAL